MSSLTDAPGDFSSFLVNAMFTTNKLHHLSLHVLMLQLNKQLPFCCCKYQN